MVEKARSRVERAVVKDWRAEVIAELAKRTIRLTGLNRDIGLRTESSRRSVTNSASLGI